MHFLMKLLRKNKQLIQSIILIGKGKCLKDIKPILSAAATNEKIGALIESDTAGMIARFGSVELDALLKYERFVSLGHIGWFWERVKCGILPYTKSSFFKLNNNAGVYPINRATLDSFYSEMLSAMPKVDLFASWVPGEVRFSKELSNSAVCELGSIEPYYHSNPWSAQLEGKRVLVIHPFTETIKRQYENKRKFLFPNSQVLPEFELLCLEAVQSIAGNQPAHKDWLTALQWMTDEAMKLDFDVAIIGCGAYGFPLSARLKSAGKKVIHLGGATQILFGIKGKRWDNHPYVSKLYNEYWCYPSENERPKNLNNIEDGCYW